jgi:hypothetical protein
VKQRNRYWHSASSFPHTLKKSKEDAKNKIKEELLLLPKKRRKKKR